MRASIFFVSILFLLALSGCESNNSPQSKAPNIILILTDDQRWDALGVAGNELIQTPEMDLLAKEGSYFKKAFVTTPICATSRASILTGMYERTHNYTFQRGPLKDVYMNLSYPLKLKEVGYQTGFFGKFGVNYKDPEALFDQAEIFDRNNRYPDKRGYYYKTIGEDTVHLTRYTGHKAQEFIENISKEKPFCLSLSFSAPHAHDSATEQYFWQEKSNKKYEDIQFEKPLLSGDEYFDALPKKVRDGFNRTRWYWRYDTPEKYQHSIKGYYRMISEIDDEIGELRKILKEKGMAQNTVFIIMGDNGYYLGERQLAGKWLMHDNSIRVPLIIYDPRVEKNHSIEDMVANIDLPSTILDLAGVKEPDAYQGISLMPYVQTGTHDQKRETLLVEHLWELPQIPSSEGIRSDKWKYFRYRFIDAPEELYDLENDPLETNNLALDPNYETILHIFRKELKYQSDKYYNEKLVSDFINPDLIRRNF